MTSNNLVRQEKMGTFQMKAVITSEEFITEGGCNACQPFTMATFDLTFEDGRSVSVEELDVPSLVMALAQKDGWQLTLDTDGMDDVLVYSKDGQSVRETTTPRRATYQKGADKLALMKNTCELTELFGQVNEVLTGLFGLEPVDFEVRPLEK